ncbi:MAG: preprotein translocase subunit YajC [Actinomycetota bacterium]
MDPSSLLLLGMMIVVFYFLLIRPQQKRLKQHQSLIAALEPGDEVITIGGIYGKVDRIEDDQIFLEVSPGTILRVSRQAVSKKSGEPGTELHGKQGSGATEAEAAEAGE